MLPFFCRMFNTLTLIKELGLDRDIKNDTKNICETCSHIQEDLRIAKHSKDVCNNFHLSVYNYDKRLPLIYCLPKLHGNPTKTNW